MWRDVKNRVNFAAHGNRCSERKLLIGHGAITMAICSMAYEAVVRVAPWMVGKKKVKE